MDSIDTSDGEDLRDDTDCLPSLCRLPLHHSTSDIPLFAEGVQTVAHLELDLQVKRQYKMLTHALEYLGERHRRSTSNYFYHIFWLLIVTIKRIS